jgi:hypothetical protein
LSNTEKTQEIAASKAGMDVKTARKYLRARVLPNERKTERHWRTRKDEFCDVWAEVKEQLSANAGLEAKTIFAAQVVSRFLCKRHFRLSVSVHRPRGRAC